MPIPIAEQNQNSRMSTSTGPIPNDRGRNTSEVQWNEKIRRLQVELNKLFETHGISLGHSKRGTKHVYNKSTPSKSKGDFDAASRCMYRDVELARMDFTESPSVITFLKEYSASTTTPEARKELEFSSQGKFILRTISEFDDLRRQLDIRIEQTTATKIWMFVNLLTVATYTILSIIAILFLMPLRLLHEPFRRLGIAQNHFLPIDLVQKFFSRGYLYVCGVNVLWEGLETFDPVRGTIGMFAHGSNLDPFIVASGPYAYKWIAKHTLFVIPFLGWVLAGWGHISINRNNLQSAQKSLSKAVEKIHRWNRCIAISPEGTRSHTGRLLDFKKGPFHTAIQVGLDVTPLSIEGAYELWPNKSLFAIGGTVRIRMLPRIPVLPTDDHNSLSSKIRRTLLIAQAEPFNGKPYTNYGPYTLWLPITWAFMYAIGLWPSIIVISLSSIAAIIGFT